MSHIPGSLAGGRLVELLFNIASYFWNGGVDLDDEDAANLGQVVIVLAVLAGATALVLWALGII